MGCMAMLSLAGFEWATPTYLEWGIDEGLRQACAASSWQVLQVRMLTREGRKEGRNIWTRERIDTRVPVSTQGATLRAAPRGDREESPLEGGEDP